MNEMTLRQKALAMNALSELSIGLDCNKNWFVSQAYIDVKENIDASVICSVTGRGATPDFALEDHWKKLTQLPEESFLVIGGMSGTPRRHVRWNGFMWQDLPHTLKVQYAD